MSGNFFEITEDDVEFVLNRDFIPEGDEFTDEEIDTVFNEINLEEVEKSAGYSYEFDEQVDLARDNIKEQIIEMELYEPKE